MVRMAVSYGVMMWSRLPVRATVVVSLTVPFDRPQHGASMAVVVYMLVPMAITDVARLAMWNLAIATGVVVTVYCSVPPSVSISLRYAISNSMPILVPVPLPTSVSRL